MLGSLIIGALAGLLSQGAEPHVKSVLDRIELDDHTFDEVELRVLSFALMLLLGALLLGILSDSGSAFWLVLGGGLGFFAQKLWGIFGAMRR